MRRDEVKEERDSAKARVQEKEERCEVASWKERTADELERGTEKDGEERRVR